MAGFVRVVGLICGPNLTRPDGPGFVDRMKLAVGGGLGVPPDRIRSE